MTKIMHVSFYNVFINLSTGKMVSGKRAAKSHQRGAGKPVFLKSSLILMGMEFWPEIGGKFIHDDIFLK